MPGCAAVGCNNRSEKGYIMKCFPRDPKLRKIWQERVARADWEPSNNSFLCHIHFKPQEWSVTQSGRIRLKKNAVPSIFTITSTRKSSKKSKEGKMKNEGRYWNNHNIEYVEDDTELSSSDQYEDKDSDDQDFEETSTQDANYLDSTEAEQEKHDINKDYETVNKNVQEGNAINLPDENVVKGNNFIMKTNVVDENYDDTILNQDFKNSHGTNDGIKSEIKPEITDPIAFTDSYDEIEEKLKQICDGGPIDDENSSYKKRNDSPIKVYKDGVQNAEVNCTFNNGEYISTSANVNYKHPSKNEISHMLNDKTENVEIIFGTESGEEKAYTAMPAADNSDTVAKLNKINESNFSEATSVKEERRIFTEDIEENFARNEVHVIPNIRAAIKRKRRTREEIMKSIKKSIGSASEQDLTVLSNSEPSGDTTDKDTENGKDRNIHSIKKYKKNCTAAQRSKFTIKVTGDPEDVTDIIEELSSQTMGKHNVQELKTSCESHQNNTFVTSVITIEDYPVVPSSTNSKALDLSDLEPPEVKNQCTLRRNTEKISYPLSYNQSVNLTGQLKDSNLSHNLQNQPLYSRSFIPCLDEGNKSLDLDISSQTQNFTSGIDKPVCNNVTNCDIREYEELQRRAKLQEEVIEKLTNQLIIYKNVENNLRNKHLALHAKTREVETLALKLNTRVAIKSQNIFDDKKSLEAKQRLIDLSNRISFLEEVNKKLMKTITAESQQKRKLEGQVKQRDNRIKELNWKLEKASKYLERAEKNTNTYRRKMLNMQTVMRRKKVLDEKMSKFNDILFDSTKEDFSSKAFEAAMEIKKTCGREGYEKLLNFGLPLPSLRLLRRSIVSDTFSDLNDSDDETIQTVPLKKNKSQNIRGVKVKVELDTKDSGVPESDAKETEFEGTETVTGTVQDIFDENNDGDDFSTNELREHFILQLNAVV